MGSVTLFNPVTLFALACSAKVSVKVPFDTEAVRLLAMAASVLFPLSLGQLPFLQLYLDKILASTFVSSSLTKSVSLFDILLSLLIASPLIAVTVTSLPPVDAEIVSSIAFAKACFPSSSSGTVAPGRDSAVVTVTSSVRSSSLEGFFDGVNDGVLVGCVEGTNVGFSLGLELGNTDPISDGAGLTVGIIDGTKLNEGLTDPISEGAGLTGIVGITDGTKLNEGSVLLSPFGGQKRQLINDNGSKNVFISRVLATPRTMTPILSLNDSAVTYCFVTVLTPPSMSVALIREKNMQNAAVKRIF